MLKFIIKHKYQLLLTTLILSYILYFSFLSIRRMYTLQSHYYDLGIMNQVVYNTFHGRFLEMTNQDLLRNVSRFAIHFDPILALLIPFYFIYNSVETLLVVQTIVIGLGGLAVFFIARYYIKNQGIALLFTVSYFLYYQVQRQTLFDVHGVVFGTTFVLFLIYFTLKKKYIPALTFLILSLLTKEHVGAVTFLFGLYVICVLKQRKYGLTVCAISLVFFFAAFGYFIPYARQQTHFAAKYYGEFGDSPKNIILGMVKDPIKTVRYLTRLQSLTYLKRFLIPFGPYIVVSPLPVLIALPEVVINAISVNKNMRDIYFHYNALIVPFLIWSSILGYNTVLKNKKLQKFQRYFLMIFIMLLGVNVYLYDQLPLSSLKEPYWWGQVNEKQLQELKDWNDKLSDSVKVASTPKIAPFLSGRQYFYNFLYDPSYANMGYKDSDIIKSQNSYIWADYVVIYTEEVGIRGVKIPTLFYNHLKSNKKFQLIWEDRSTKLEVYKKI